MKPRDELTRRLQVSLTRLLPRPYTDRIESLLAFTDYEMDVYTYLGSFLLYGLPFSIVFAPLLSTVFSIPLIFIPLLFLGLYVAVQLLAYLMIVFAVARKASSVETMLPDALQLTASHIRAGLTPEKALLVAARPEFGTLEREIRRIAKEVITGKNLEAALMGITKRVRSTLLDRTMTLIVEGIKSGGQIAVLLEETAEDIRNATTLRNEIRSNVMMYVIFIFLATAFGAPLLYAVSTYLIESISSFSNLVTPESQSTEIFANSPIQFKASPVSIPFLVNFAVASMLTTAVFSGIILGLIETGNERAGAKYIPAIMAVGLIVFFGIRALIGGVFTGIIGAV